MLRYSMFNIELVHRAATATVNSTNFLCSCANDKMRIINSHLWCLLSLPKKKHIRNIALLCFCFHHQRATTVIRILRRAHNSKGKNLSAFQVLHAYFESNSLDWTHSLLLLYSVAVKKDSRSLSIATKVTLQCILNMLHRFGVVIQRVCGIYSNAKVCHRNVYNATLEMCIIWGALGIWFERFSVNMLDKTGFVHLRTNFFIWKPQT